MTSPGRIAALGLLAAAIVGLVLLAAWNWDPFHRRQRAERRAAQSAEAATAASLAAEGAQGTNKRLDVAVGRRDAARAATARLELSAHRSEDADAKLAPDRARRLLEHDRELCRISPSLSGCAAADRDARRGHPPVRALSPAG